MWHDPALKMRSSEEGEDVDYDFLGVSSAATESIFGLEAYLDKYGQCDPEGPNLHQRREEFDDFYLDVPFARKTVRVLRCPEDRECEDEACKRGNNCCTKCRIPVCLECGKTKLTVRASARCHH